eukprot:873453-Pleurochrysis_carterae.AAC.1
MEVDVHASRWKSMCVEDARYVRAEHTRNRAWQESKTVNEERANADPLLALNSPLQGSQSERPRSRKARCSFRTMLLPPRESRLH